MSSTHLFSEKSLVNYSKRAAELERINEHFCSGVIGEGADLMTISETVMQGADLRVVKDPRLRFAVRNRGRHLRPCAGRQLPKLTTFRKLKRIILVQL